MARWFVDRSPQRGIPSVSLRRALPDARFAGAADWEVSGCCADSRRLEPGQVFVAIRGPHFDGHDFVADALDRGAAGVVVDRPCPPAGPLQAMVADTRLAHASLCHALAGDPSGRVRVVAVAGTHGVTAAGLFARSIFEAAGIRTGTVAGPAWSDGVTTRAVGHRPLCPESLSKMLAATAERGTASSLIEVDSSALSRRALAGVGLASAVITSLDDPLDDAPDRAASRRRNAARLVRQVLPGGVAVLNADDPDADLLCGSNLDARCLRYGVDRPADVTAVIDRLDAAGSRFLLLGLDREATVRLALPGRGKVLHALAAASLCHALGVEAGAIVAGLEAVSRVPDRLEPVAFDRAQARDSALSGRPDRRNPMALQRASA